MRSLGVKLLRLLSFCGNGLVGPPMRKVTALAPALTYGATMVCMTCFPFEREKCPPCKAGLSCETFVIQPPSLPRAAVSRLWLRVSRGDFWQRREIFLGVSTENARHHATVFDSAKAALANALENRRLAGADKVGELLRRKSETVLRSTIVAGGSFPAASRYTPTNAFTST
jgi:hypothetical protein